MNANELRIGNLVFLTSKKEFFKITDISSHNSTLSSKVYCRSLSEFEPIPITIELLLQFGFKKCKKHSTYCDPEYRKKIRNSWNSYICFNFVDDWTLPYSCDIKELPSTVYDIKENHYSFPVNNLKINYIHQLQNLFFSLTGKELVFNSNTECCL